jgi:hypothetical protein
MRFLIFAVAGLGLLLGAGLLGVMWLTRWLAGRAADRLSVEELDQGLAIPMRDSNTRRTPRPPTP